MSTRIQNCYDSHTHFLATGQVAAGLKLQSLSDENDVAQLKIRPEHYRADWLIGFGWDQNKWPNGQFPRKESLDAHFPQTPVIFSRVDGHSSWLNSQAINRLKEKGFDFKNEQSGMLFEQDHVRALSSLPPFTREQNKFFLQTSQKIFNRAGFTHLRDLSMNLDSWKILHGMAEANDLTVCVDSFVTAENHVDVERAVHEIREMKNQPHSQLKAHGVKIFVDGSLGSKTAYLSANYIATENRGVFLWSPEDIKKTFVQVWNMGLDMAVHTIGDQAAHEVVSCAREVSAMGILGRLHLEHVEILRSETVQMMKPLHVTCYLQPSHWTSDESWLTKILPPSVHRNIFQWELLRKNKIPFFFGSDSPIEPPQLFAAPRALKQSAKAGVPELRDDWKKYHAHPDTKWTNSWTEFRDEQITQVFFDGRPLF